MERSSKTDRKTEIEDMRHLEILRLCDSARLGLFESFVNRSNHWNQLLYDFHQVLEDTATSATGANFISYTIFCSSQLPSWASSYSQ